MYRGKLLTTQVENLLAVSHLIQHKTFSALSYTQDFGNRVKGSVKRTTSSTFTEMSNCPLPNAFMPLLALSTMSLPSVQTMTKEDEVGMGVDWRENFPPVYHQTIRSEPTQDKAGTLPSASRDCHAICYLFKKLIFFLASIQFQK